MYTDSQMKDSLSTYATSVSQALLKSDFSALSHIAETLLSVMAKQGTVFTAGNGGSHATASHMANDLTKGCRVYGREGFRAVCLGDASAVVTCLANDFSYEDVYAIQLKTLAHPGDVLVVFSGSGNSPNVLRAAKLAKELGVTTVGFLGRDGGELKKFCDISIIAPTYSMEQLEDLHLIYEHALVTAMRERLSDSWGIEVVNFPGQDRRPKHVLFDFDGTISLIRQGWQDVMVPYFVEVLQETPGARDESLPDLQACVREFVDKLTGKQTIFQCIALDQEVVKRGGIPRNPSDYKTEYLHRLMERIGSRQKGLSHGSISPSELLVPGIHEFLSLLDREGVKLYLASGTDDADVKREAELLGVDKYFKGHIYGALDRHATECTKELVIKEILSQAHLTSASCGLVGFGDGFVEIELVKSVGGYAVAVASDEVRKMGIDEWKRQRLLGAGADAVIPDFSEPSRLLSFLKGEW